MTVPSVVGSVTEIKSSAGSGSQSVTVPTGATLLLVLTAWWQSGVPDYTTLSLNGTSFTANKVVENASDSYECSNIYYLKSPATGTFSWAISTSEGAHIFLVFLKDTNASPITGSNTGQSSGDPVTGSFATSTNDFIVGVGCAYGATSGDAGVSGQTELFDGGNYNSAYGVVGTKAGSAGTTTFTVDFTGSGMANSVCAVSIAGTTGGTTYNQSADGGITPAGAIAKSTNKPLAGGNTPAGALTKQTNKAFTGGFTPSGVMTKQISKIVTGAISSIVGELSTIRLFIISLSGGITPSGTIAKQTNKTADGSITPSGAITRSVAKVVSGALSSIVGSISRLTSKAFTGDITPSGIITSVRTFLVSISGGITPSGTVAKSTSKAFTGSVTPDGTISKAVAKSAAGSDTPSGSIVKQIAKSISGIISSIVGALTTVFTSNSVEGEAAVSDSTIYAAGATDSATRSASASDSTRFAATINDVEST